MAAGARARGQHWDQVVQNIGGNSKYALTGSIIAAVRVAISRADANLRFVAGNF